MSHLLRLELNTHGERHTPGQEPLLTVAQTGHWASEILETPPFKRLVVSWNANTYPDTSVEIWIRVRVHGTWSMWFSYGKWTTDGLNTGSFSGQKDTLARLDIDELVVLGPHGGHGEAIQLKAEMTRNHVGVPMPLLKRLFVSLDAPHNAELQPEPSFQDSHQLHAGDPAPLPGLVAPLSKQVAPLSRQVAPLPGISLPLPVPPRAQLSVEDIGNRICSPTSVAMVMAYYGWDRPTEQVAHGTRDNGTSIYGNWSYNMAYAGEGPFVAYAHYCYDFEAIARWISEGKPIVASITLKDAKDLTGATQAYPSGHLLVITGLEYSSEGIFVLANDPAAYTPEAVPRRYPLDQFLKAWKNLIYWIVPEVNA